MSSSSGLQITTHPGAGSSAIEIPVLLQLLFWNCGENSGNYYYFPSIRDVIVEYHCPWPDGGWSFCRRGLWFGCLSPSYVVGWTGLCLLSLQLFIRAGKIPMDFLSRSFFSRCFVELHCLVRFVSSGLEVYLRTAVDDWIISSRTVLEWRSFLKVLRLFCFVCLELVSRSASRLIINYQHSTVYCGQ